MSNNIYNKTFYLFEGMTAELLPENLVKTIQAFLSTENLYLSATREIATKLENLNCEFRYMHDRNPIQNIQTRVKSPASIINKLRRKGWALTVESARQNLTDIAGVRVICSYIDDIYLISRLLTSQSDVEVVRTSDYIKNPKPNGYRSLHHIVTVPVFLSTGPEPVHVEIQIRTIAMDFWASLEHEIAYKLLEDKRESIASDLKECADDIARIDRRMQEIFNFPARREEVKNGDPGIAAP